MAMTRAQWDALQAKLPAEDRMSYEDYLAQQNEGAAPGTGAGADTGAGTGTGASAGGNTGAASDTGADDGEWVTHWKTGLRAKKGTSLGDLYEKQNAERAVRDAAYANKPTEDPGAGYRWFWKEREQTWAKLFVGTGSSGGGGGGGGGGDNTGGGGNNGTTTVQTYTAPDGRIFTDLNAYNAYIAKLEADRKRQAGLSAYNLLFEQFNQFGLGALVEPLQNLITEGLSAAEFTLRLRETDAYKKRFAANAQRIAKGLRALSEAEYITLEDQYQNVMRNYGLPASYYARGDMGRQEGFEKFISGDVSAAELEDRIQTAQNRVINAAPEVSRALREFYPGISNGDILAYALDPDKALTDIRRKVTAAEIGAGAMQAGLATGVARAEELGRFGVTGEQARQGFATIAEFLPSAQKLGDIYARQGMGPFTQATAEQEVFGIAGAADAAAKRKRLTQLEQAQFAGSSGMAGGALARDRAGAI